MTRLEQAFRWWAHPSRGFREELIPGRHVRVLERHKLLAAPNEYGEHDLNDEGQRLLAEWRKSTQRES